MISIDVIQRSAQMLLPDLDGCYWVISVHENTHALRVVALGRRNYMFFGSDGGDSAAVMYSLIGSCKLNGIEPEAWLRHIISVINTWPANRVKELLPWNVTLSVN